MFYRKSFIFLVGIFFTLLTNYAFAQYPGMQQVYSRINQQGQNQAMQSLMRGMAMNNVKNFDYEPLNAKYTFQVTLKDSTVHDINSQIFIDTAHHRCYLYYIDKELEKKDPLHCQKLIYPNETISLSRIFINDDNDSVKVFGAPNDSCWMFKTIKGRINVYSYLSEVGDSFEPSTTIGIQAGIDNPIEKFTKDNLRKMIVNDSKAMKYFDKEDYFAAIERFNSDKSK